MDELDVFIDQFYSKYSPNDIPDGDRRVRLKQKLSQDFDGYVTQMYQKYAPDNVPDSTRLANLKTKYLKTPVAEEQSVLGTVGDYLTAGVGAFNRGVSQVISEPLKVVGAGGNWLQSVVTGEDVDPNSGIFTQAGQAVTDVTNEINPVDPNVNQTFQDVAQGLGQGIGMMATAGTSAAPTLATAATNPSLVSAAGRALGQVGKQAISPAGIVGGSMVAAPEWQAAKEAGLSDDEAFETLVKNYFVGISESVPITNMLSRLNKATGNAIVEKLKTVGLSGLEEATQEAFQTYVTNEIAKGSYDPERDPMAQVLQSGKVGGLVGLILPGVGMAVTPSAKVQEQANVEKNQVGNSTPEVNQDIDNATKEVALNITNAFETTSQVPVQPEATISEEVAQGTPETRPQEASQEEVNPVPFAIESTKGEELTPQEAADKFQGFITGVGDEAITQITEYAEGKFNKRSQFEQFVELYNDKNERKISDVEANRVWDRLKTPRPKSDTSKKIKITEMQGLKKQIQDFARGIKEGRIDARKESANFANQVTEKLGKAELTPSQTKSIIKKIGNVDLTNPVKRAELLRHVDKVSQDAEYAEKIDKAESIQKKLKSAVKSKDTFASYKPALEKLSKLNISNLDEIQNIDDYISLGEKYLNSKKDVKSAKYNPTDLAELSDYAERAFTESKLVADELAKEAYGVEGDFTKEELDYIFKETDEYYENAADAKRKELNDKLQTAASYSKLALESNDSEVARSIQKIDISKLDPNQLKRYIRTVDNLVANGDESGTGALIALGEAMSGYESLASKKVVARNMGIIAESGYNLPNIMKAMFGLTKTAGEVRQASGINDFFAGASRAKTQRDDMAAKFDELTRSLGKKYKKDVLSRTEIARMAIASNLLGYDQGSDPQAAFERNKRNVEESNAREMAADPDNGAFVNSLYEPFKVATDFQQVKDILQKQFPDNWEIMNFFRNSFDEIKSEQQKASIRDDNRYAPLVEDYFPRRYVKSQADRQTLEEVKGKFDELRIFNASSSFSRNKSLPANSVIDLSFIDSMFTSYQNTLMDMYANPGIMKMKAFYSLPDVTTMLGGTKNADRFIGVLKYDVNRELGTYGFKQSDLVKTFNKIADTLKNAAYIRALASPTQYLKQSTVLANTIIRLGNPKYLFGTPTDAPIYKYYSIGQRGSRLGGIDAGDFIDQRTKYDLSNTIADRLGKLQLGLERNVWHRLTASLRNTDVFSAKKSWGAFFKKYMKEEYKIDVDLATAHEQLNDERYKNAAAYAEQMVGETQIASSAGESAQLLSPTNGAHKAMLAIFLPFSNFAWNNKARFLNASKYLVTGNSQERQEAASAMVGILTEVAAFNAVGYVLATTLAPAIDDLIRSMFGFEEPDRDEEEVEIFRQQVINSNVMRDLNPVAIQQNVNDFFLTRANEMSANSLREEGYTEEEIKQRVPFYVRNQEQGLLDGSMYSIPLKGAIDWVNGDAPEIDYENDVIIIKDKFGNTKEVPMDQNLENYMRVTTVAEALSMLGISLSDINNSIERVKKEQIKQAKQ